MPIQSTLTLDSVVYNPRGTNNGVTKWVRAEDTPFGGGQSEVTASIREITQQGVDPKTRIKDVVTSPVTAVEASACACPGQTLGLLQATLVIDMTKFATKAQRTAFRKRFQAWVASAGFATMIDDLEGYYT